MGRYWLIWIVVAALALPSARGQAFPFEDTFTDYAPGSTGAPAWSILDGSFHTENGALQGPVTLRFNARPPHQYVADLTLAMTGAEPGAWVYINHQHDGDTDASDVITLRGSASELSIGSTVPGGGETARAPKTARCSSTGAPIALSIVVDADTGRHAVFVDGKPLITGAPLEYAAGLFSVRLGEGAGLDHIVLRAPNAAEKRALAFTTLLNDPRDATDGDGGNILVLHRTSPAVLTLTPDGEVTRTFGRRGPGGIPDPVAIARGPRGEVLVLNRFPGEVVVFERNGGVRQRFGRGHLKEPTDLVVQPNGTVYVSDIGARAVVVFRSDGQRLGAVTTFGGVEATPVRLGQDTFNNLMVMLDKPAGVVTLRPGPDQVAMALLSRTDAPIADVAVADGRLLAYNGAMVSDGAGLGDRAFQASSVGGLAAGGRLATVGDTVYALDRNNSRLVVVPPDLADTDPTVSFLNLAQSAALVRWNSAQPSRTARVRVTHDGRSVSEKQTNKEATTTQEVPIAGLKPGREYRYAVSPTSATIPPTDWSVEYTFTTDGAPERKMARPDTTETESAP